MFLITYGVIEVKSNELNIILFMNKRIWLSLAHMGGREQDFIKEAFDTNWVVPLGPNVDAFEQSLAEYLHEDRRVVALSAGTAALHLGLILLDVKPGDEVICQSFTLPPLPIQFLIWRPNLFLWTVRRIPGIWIRYCSRRL